jgi:hypothetical protein
VAIHEPASSLSAFGYRRRSSPAPLTLHSGTEEGARAPSKSLLALHPDTHEGAPLLNNLNPDTEQAVLTRVHTDDPSRLFYAS